MISIAETWWRRRARAARPQPIEDGGEPVDELRLRRVGARDERLEVPRKPEVVMAQKGNQAALRPRQALVVRRGLRAGITKQVGPVQPRIAERRHDRRAVVRTGIADDPGLERVVLLRDETGEAEPAEAPRNCR